jgi:hypothetical protein
LEEGDLGGFSSFEGHARIMEDYIYKAGFGVKGISEASPPQPTA